MTELEATVRAPNSLLVVGDPSAGLPATMGGNVVAATSQCIAIGTLAEGDGSTRVRLVAGEPAASLGSIAFDGVLRLASGRFTVENVLDAWLVPFRRFWSKHVDALEQHLEKMEKVPSVKGKKRYEEP